MTLREIFDGLPIQDSAYDGGLAVTGITYDSRKVRKGSLFVCIEGFITDGHRFAGQAASQGAVALLVQKPVDSVGCAWACVPDTRAALALVSKRFFQDPCSRMSVAGVTGTSGKTSVSFLLRSILEASGHRTGLIGPVANIFDGEESFAVRSTPESSDLLALLDEMTAAGIKDCVMEVSSQGIQLGRIDGCSFSAGVFSNLYSDYVGMTDPPAFTQALDSKIRFARRCREIIVNRDAEYAEAFLSLLGAPALQPALTYGLTASADVRAENIRPEKREGRLGSVFSLASPWFSGEVFLGLPCRYQVSNALAAIACAALKGAKLEDIRCALSAAVIPGCAEPIGGRTDFGVFIDSAHTPQTMSRLLCAMREYTAGRLLCVFGCNGNTMAATRSAMGREVSLRADLAFVAPDNPYLEDPARIAADIVSGFGGSRIRPIVYDDRSRAIYDAVSEAREGDIVIIAGKGHHNYQMFGSRTEWFSDAEHAARALDNLE